MDPALREVRADGRNQLSRTPDASPHVASTPADRPLRCVGVRGAITVAADTVDAILTGTRALLTGITRANGMAVDDIAAVFFSTTPDLTAEYPALAARQLGWTDVAFLCSHEMHVAHGLPRCVRVLVLWNTTRGPHEVEHVYLGEARRLRPDRAPDARAPLVPARGGDAADPLADRTVHITGLGLMGASLALALRGHVRALCGDDIDPSVVSHALERGIIDGTGGREQADLIVLAIPADAILDALPALEARAGALVLDMGSTKGRIVERMAGLPPDVFAVGGHPLCGRAESGIDVATGLLFRGARFLLCRTRRTDASAVTLAESLVRAVGAVPMWLDAARHDEALALTSHLPHLMAYALAGVAGDAAAQDGSLHALTGGGFHGATRLAASDAAMVRGMLSTNAAHVRAAATAFRARVDALAALLDDAADLHDALARCNQARKGFGPTIP